MSGTTVSHVKYTLVANEIASWANHPAIQKSWPKIAKTIEKFKKGVEKEGTFMLTNNGWVHESLYH